MKIVIPRFLLAFCLSTFFSAAVMAQLPHLVFHAELNGAEQIPSVSTVGRGLITLIYSPDRSKVKVSGLMVDVQDNITAASLHIGKTGETGALLLDLMPVLQGRRLDGEISVPAALLQNLLPDRVYASVSTLAHPSGEIRGQFICETDLDFKGVLTGNEMVPATVTPAFGFGGFHFPTGSEDLVYAFLIRDLSSAVTEVSLYKGDPGENGVFVHLLPGYAGGFVQGKLELDELPPNSLRDLREGKFYVLVKTENFPDGEIRGQLEFLGYFTSFAPVNKVQQVPNPGNTPGFAFSHNELNQTLDSLMTTVFVNGITPTSVDIHIAEPGVNGPVFITLDPSPTLGLYRKVYKLDDSHMTDFVEGRLYVSVKTASHPNGEIRGQMKNSLRKGYAFDLCKNQMVPPTNSTGIGVGMASVDQANCYLNYKIIHDRLIGTLTEALICQAPATMNGSALYPLPINKPLMPGHQEILASHGVAIELGETYVMLVSDQYPNGEIRGQIVRGFSCPEVTGVSILQNLREVNVSPVPFNTELNLSFDSQSPFEGRIVLYDAFGIQSLVLPVQIMAGPQTIQIPTVNLPNGFYTMMLETPNKGSSMVLKKLIRQD
jgi:CHRD domain